MLIQWERQFSGPTDTKLIGRRPYVRATGRGVRPVFWGEFAPGLLVGISLPGQHQRPRNWNPCARGITPVVSDMKLRACSQSNHVFSKARPVGGSGGNRWVMGPLNRHSERLCHIYHTASALSGCGAALGTIWPGDWVTTAKDKEQKMGTK